MWYLIVFYWIVAGFVSFGLPEMQGATVLEDFLISFLLGGFFIPARFLTKVIR